MSQRYLKAVDDFIKPYLEKEKYEFIKSEFVNEDGNYYLRVYIDLKDELKNERSEAILNSEEKPEFEEGFETPGVHINDCVKVSRYLSKWLDKEDFIKEAYTLEVCSKGFLNGSHDDDNEGEEK